MWPWEHFAVGYLVYSLAVRLLRQRTPSGVEFAAVLFGSQFADLVDKPASWLFHVFPSGVSVAHSVFVAVPLTAGIALVCRRVGYSEVGAAFGVSYLLHLPSDALYGTVTRGAPPSYRVFLWPVAPKSTSVPGGFLTNVGYLFDGYRTLLLTDPQTAWFLVFEVVLVSATVLLWLADGTPGLAVVDDRLRAQ